MTFGRTPKDDGRYYIPRSLALYVCYPPDDVKAYMLNALEVLTRILENKPDRLPPMPQIYKPTPEEGKRALRRLFMEWMLEG